MTRKQELEIVGALTGWLTNPQVEVKKGPENAPYTYVVLPLGSCSEGIPIIFVFTPEEDKTEGWDGERTSQFRNVIESDEGNTFVIYHNLKKYAASSQRNRTEAQRYLEVNILSLIREATERGEAWNEGIRLAAVGKEIQNALKRLKDSGRIRYNKPKITPNTKQTRELVARMGWVTT